MRRRRADAGRDARAGRGRLPHRRHQGRRRGHGRRDGHRRAQPGRRSRWPATATPSRWCSAGCTRSTATSTPTCARRSSGCGSTTRRSPTSPRRRGARLRLPLRLPRAAAHGDRPRAARARVRPRPDRHRAERRVPGERRRTASGSRWTTRPRCRDEIEAIEEPYVKVTILTPTEYIGTLMELCKTRRGRFEKMEYLSEERVELVYTLPLAEIVIDFFDQMKSPHAGVREPRLRARRLRPANLVEVDVLLNGEPVDAFSPIVHRDKAVRLRTRCREKLRELIPRQCSTCRSRPRSAGASSPARR